jgi:DNA-binding transcriptional MocR family regulator
MNLWVTLPAPLDAGELLPRVQRESVTYLPGKHFSIGAHVPGTLRLSFGALSPAEIESGLRIAGSIFTQELEQARAVERFETASAMV